MKNLYKQGTNQYQIKRKGFQFRGYKEVAIICLILTPVIFFGNMAEGRTQGKYVSPLPQASYANTVTYKAYQLPSLAPLPQREANKDLIRRIWGKDAYIGLAIARAESGYRSTATNHNTNGTTDEGCFQINSVHNIPNMLDATANISYAYALYLKQGTSPWYSSKHNWINWIAVK